MTMNPHQEHQAPRFTLTVGFDCGTFSDRALEHGRSTGFKRCIQSFLETEFGCEMLTELSRPQRDHQCRCAEDVDDEAVLRLADRRLCECSTPMNTAVIRGRSCLYVPPNTWRKVRMLSVHRSGRPLTAHEATVQYEERCRGKGRESLDARVRDELAALPLLLGVSWVVEL